MKGNLKLAIGLAGAAAIIWLLSDDANAAVPGARANTCTAPNVWVAVGPGSSAGELALAKKYGDGSGYCSKRGEVSDAGTQPLGAVDTVTSSLSNALNAGLTGLKGFFSGSTSSAPASGPVTDPSQVADAGAANDPQWTPELDA